MPSTLAIYILVGVSFFSSLASLPIPNILAPMESSLTLTAPSNGSAVTTLTTSPTSLSNMSGYLVVATYSDSFCKTPLSAVIRVLNRCYGIGPFAYVYITATKSSYRIDEFTDDRCLVYSKSTGASFTDGVCGAQLRIVSFSLTSQWVTDIATISLRWINSRISMRPYTIQL